MRKQDAINAYLDEINMLKRELSKEKLETELVKRKLESYLNSAYVLDHIVSVKPTRGEGVCHTPPTAESARRDVMICSHCLYRTNSMVCFINIFKT